MTAPGSRPRVAYLITSSGLGGAELEVRDLALAFRRRGWDAGVISMLELGPPFTELGSAGIRTASLDMTRGIADPRALARLRTLLREWRPDVLHAHMVHANLLARVSRLFARTPVLVSTIHNQDEGPQWRYWAYRATARLSDVTTAVSAAAVETAVRRGAARSGRIILVPNGLDTTRFRPDTVAREQTRRALGLTDEFAWLAVGRLVEAKDHPTLIAAFRRALDDHPEARLLIAGTGPLEQAVAADIRRSGVTETAALLGLRPDIAALMQAADGFVLSSAWEGLPMVLLEAAASALPIVATDVGGSREAVIDGISGYVVPPRDSLTLGRQMGTVMSMSPRARAEMGSAGREHAVRSFDLETIADVWEGLYRRQLAHS